MRFRLSWRDGAYRVNRANLLTDRESMEVIDYVSHLEEMREQWEARRRQQDTALQATRCLNDALSHIEEHNYGQARRSIERAQAHLPWDNGEHIVWPSAEDK